MAKTKKESKTWAFLKWTAAVAGGAIVGAYAVRYVDRKLGYGQRNGGDIETESLGEENPSSPLSGNPLAISAISPLVPVAVPIPTMQAMPQLPQLPSLPPLPSYGGFSENPAPPPTREQIMQEREASLDEICDRFERGEFD